MSAHGEDGVDGGSRVKERHEEREHSQSRIERRMIRSGNNYERHPENKTKKDGKGVRWWRMKEGVDSRKTQVRQRRRRGSRYEVRRRREVRKGRP